MLRRSWLLHCLRPVYYGAKPQLLDVFVVELEPLLCGNRCPHLFLDLQASIVLLVLLLGLELLSFEGITLKSQMWWAVVGIVIESALTQGNRRRSLQTDNAFLNFLCLRF